MPKTLASDGQGCKAAAVDNEPVANPKVLLVVAAVVGFVLSAIAIFIAVSYAPDSGSSNVTSTSTVPAPVQPTRP